MQEFSSKSWDPKVQVPYKVDSGNTPRKLEIERRKRQYSRQAQNLESLLTQHHVRTQELMPITDRSSKALLQSSSTHSDDSTPVFPSFLPLEIFDNTEFDSRTPEEWLELGTLRCLGRGVARGGQRGQMPPPPSFQKMQEVCQLLPTD